MMRYAFAQARRLSAISRHSRPRFKHSRAGCGGNPELLFQTTLDSHLRGNDGAGLLWLTQSTGKRGNKASLIVRLCCVLVFSTLTFPVSAADPQKVLRTAFKIAETNFDPGVRDDFYSIRIIGNVFDALLTYDYLARPARVVPSVAEEMPAISPDGLTYTVRIKRGIYVTPDPAFKGQKRELTAADFVYSFKRTV